MKPEVGPIVRATALAERDEDGAAHLPGTFGFALEMYTAFAEQQIVFILREELIVNELVAPLLVHLYLLLDVIPTILPQASGTRDDTDGQFLLKHTENKGDHNLVDDSLNIVGVID
ncbi:uncharacterized protein B0H18DRAFT_1044365 [Fomitopsis serialis]|uniref:uncharacterized protein n=1 Tax=Fomitopsis serialis TaxID=139415 RepID=UPI0020080F18|nr:uncharacterized protein B0H18DRAFT_1044365 [Neoantrodia serialis]KAH9914711.1 hypothetical protein B0H18DRAFT_1044365 [Neoantrodia serialis]